MQSIWALHPILVTWFLVVFCNEVTEILCNGLFTFFTDQGKTSKTETQPKWRKNQKRSYQNLEWAGHKGSRIFRHYQVCCIVFCCCQQMHKQLLKTFSCSQSRQKSKVSFLFSTQRMNSLIDRSKMNEKMYIQKFY